MEDLLSLYYFTLFWVVLLIKDVSTITLSVSKSADNAILGDNPFTLSCQYTIATNEQLYSLELQRKRDSDSSEAFDRIVTFPDPFSPLNVTYRDASLQSRSVTTKPTEQSRTAIFQFNRIECDDKATYRWNAFYTDGSNKNAFETISLTVRANTLFVTDGILTFTPSTNIEEGDVVTFTCTGDVGNEPVGHLGWYYYLGNDTSNPINASDKATTQAPVYSPSTCSYRRTSSLQLKMTRLFNNILVRCTVHQDNYNQFGDGHKQTKNIPIHLSPIKLHFITNEKGIKGMEGIKVTFNKSEKISLLCFTDADIPFDIVIRKQNEEKSTVMKNETFAQHTIQNASCLDAGEYVCSARNMSAMEQELKSVLILSLQCPPLPLNGNTQKKIIESLQNLDVTLSFQTSEYYDDSNRTVFMWFKRNSFVINDCKKYSILTSGFLSVLIIRNLSKTDFGQYSLVARNSNGQYTHYFKLQEKENSKVKETVNPNQTRILIGVVVGSIGFTIIAIGLACIGYRYTRRKQNDRQINGQDNGNQTRFNFGNTTTNHADIRHVYGQLDEQLRDRTIYTEIQQSTETDNGEN